MEQKKNDGRGKKPFRNFGKRPEEKGIPILKFGKITISTSSEQHYPTKQRKDMEILAN